MRIVAAILLATLLVGCSTPFWVTGRYRRSLTPSDVQQIAAIARKQRPREELTKVYVNTPDRARLEFRSDYAAGRSFTRFDIVKQDGKWTPAKAPGSDETELELETIDWSGSH